MNLSIHKKYTIVVEHVDRDDSEYSGCDNIRTRNNLLTFKDSVRYYAIPFSSFLIATFTEDLEKRPI